MRFAAVPRMKKRKKSVKSCGPSEELQGPPARETVSELSDRERAVEDELSVVDDLGAALGVPRAPDEEFRPSAEILESRDRNRREREE